MQVFVVINRVTGFILGVFANESAAHGACEHANMDACMQGGNPDNYRVSAEPVL